MPFGPPIEVDGLSEHDRSRADRFNRFQADGLASAFRRPARRRWPTRSPIHRWAVGGIVEKFHEWTDPAKSAAEAVDRDQLLTNVSIYWFTRSGGSSAHATYDGMQAWRAMASQEAQRSDSGWSPPAGPPTGVAVFAADSTIRRLTDPDGKIVHWSEFDRGGHFRPWRSPTCWWPMSVPSSGRFGRSPATPVRRWPATAVRPPSVKVDAHRCAPASTATVGGGHSVRTVEVTT
jgi:hypothetical protein